MPSSPSPRLKVCKLRRGRIARTAWADSACHMTFKSQARNCLVPRPPLRSRSYLTLRQPECTMTGMAAMAAWLISGRLFKEIPEQRDEVLCCALSRFHCLLGLGVAKR